MKARIFYEHLAPNEWGSPLMVKIADERFQKDATLDIVHVDEHAGWFLSFRRDGKVVNSANDAAFYPASIESWREQFTDSVIVGECRRADDGNHQETLFETSSQHASDI